MTSSRIPEICIPPIERSPRSTSVKTNDSQAGDHVIGAFVGKPSGPTLIVIGSLHGNEPGGAAALAHISGDLDRLTNKLKGRVYFLVGNTRALCAGSRFIDTDLNRGWTAHNMSAAGPESLFSKTTEGVELAELDQILDSILITAMDEVFVLDLHSTSSKGMPFATVGDTLRNRKFAQAFPVPILLGIEEQLEGTMLEYLNNLGAVTLGFEGGQHLSAETVENHKAMAWLALKNAGILDEADVPELGKHMQRFSHENHKGRIFEIRYRHAISPDDAFVMKPGFNNFDGVNRGDFVADDRNGPVATTEPGVMLMPLYQKLGEDGFFIGREIFPFWLRLSGFLRRIGIQNLIHILPGVCRNPDDAATLIVDTRVARLFPLQIFHLLGFRRRRWVGKNLIVSRRRHDTAGPFKWKDR